MLSPRARNRMSTSQSNSMKNIHQPHNMHHNHQHPQLSQSHSHQNINPAMYNHQHQAMQLSLQQQQQLNSSINNIQDIKSRSVSRLPGINVYPSQNDDTLQIPIGSSTGSLPDLTLVHFQSPISTPIDDQIDPYNPVSYLHTV